MKKLKKLDLSVLAKLGENEMKSIVGGESSAYPTYYPTRVTEDTWTGGIRPAYDSVLYSDEGNDGDA